MTLLKSLAMILATATSVTAATYYVDYNGGKDANRQLEQIKDCIAQGADGIILTADDSDSETTGISAFTSALVTSGRLAAWMACAGSAAYWAAASGSRTNDMTKSSSGFAMTHLLSCWKTLRASARSLDTMLSRACSCVIGAKPAPAAATLGDTTLGVLRR